MSRLFILIIVCSTAMSGRAAEGMWLRAYCHLLCAMVEGYRAVDEEAGFERRVSGIFPKLEASTREPEDFRWQGLKVVDSPRLRRMRLHLVMVCELNRETWTHIRNETDEDYEWLPHPKQSDQLGLPLTDGRIDAWLSMMAQWEGLLKGERLIPGYWLQRAVPEGTLFFPQYLQKAGYKTGFIGKWHLGGEEHFPVTQRFDHSVAETKAGWPDAYFYPWPQVKNLKGEKGDYLTDRLTDEVIKHLEQSHDHPSFFHLSFFSPHRPTQAKEDLIRKYEAKLSPEHVQRNPTNAGMIETLDENVGRIMQSLDDQKLADKTLLIFASDNGGTHNADLPQKTNNAPLRDGKGSAYEGAYRVPLIIRWPGNVPTGSETSEPVSSIDFFPTLQALTGKQRTAEQELDGVNLLPLLLKQQPLGRSALHWHYPHYHHGGASPHGVIRKGKFRLIEHFDGTQAELYDIENDLGETVNLVYSMPEKSKELLSELREWRHEVGAQMPTLNPNDDPERVHEWIFFLESRKRK